MRTFFQQLNYPKQFSSLGTAVLSAEWKSTTVLDSQENANENRNFFRRVLVSRCLDITV